MLSLESDTKMHHGCMMLCVVHIHRLARGILPWCLRDQDLRAAIAAEAHVHVLSPGVEKVDGKFVTWQDEAVEVPLCFPVFCLVFAFV